MMSINAVKAVEIGAGFSLSEIPGKEAGDQMVMSDDGPEFLSNNSLFVFFWFFIFTI